LTPMKTTSTCAPILIATSMLMILACTCADVQQLSQIPATLGALQQTAGPALTAIKQNQPTVEAAMTQFAAGVPGVEATLTAVVGMANTAAAEFATRQWAVTAVATSERSLGDSSANQATGAPNAGGCADSSLAWSSAAPNGADTLTLRYSTSVTPTSIVIYHAFNPGSVIRVEVAVGTGNVQTVYTGGVYAFAECPYAQSIPVSGVEHKIDTVIITLDQSIIGIWDQIDAVELVGYP